MIPKRIFYVWGYDEEKSRLANICIENWRMMLPDYEIIEINEKTPEWFDFNYEYNNCLWFKTVYDLKMWAYVSDYIRVKTLLDHGGIYLDTDVTVYKKFDDLLTNKMFIGNVINNIPEMAICGAQAHSSILKKMYEFYQNKIWKSPAFIITAVLKEILEKDYSLQIDKDKIVKNEDITIYPYDYFCPYHYGQSFSHDCITENTYSVHWENSSWHSKKNIFFLTNKHRLPLKVLLKQLEFIEKVDKNANKKTTLLPLISVVMSVRNGSNYIKEAIEGIKRQKMNTEIIVVDNASEDNTVEIAESLGCKVIKHETDKGFVMGKNTGIKAAKGDYILFHDHDDILRDGALSHLLNELNNDKNISAVMAKVQDFFSPEISEEEKKTTLLKKEPFWGLYTGALLMRKELFDKIGLFDESLTAGDMLYLQHKMDEHNLKIKKIDYVSCNRRIHNSNYGKTDRKNEFKNYASVLRAKLARK